MQVAVWDTYVTKKDRSIMHFDIIVPTDIKDTSIIYEYGRNYLKSKGQEDQVLAAKQCRFCHIESVDTKREAEILSNGYYIIEIDNCE